LPGSLTSTFFWQVAATAGLHALLCIPSRRNAANFVHPNELLTALRPSRRIADTTPSIKNNYWRFFWQVAAAAGLRVLRVLAILLAYRTQQLKNNYFTMCSGSEAGSYLRLIDFCSGRSLLLLDYMFFAK